MKQRKDGRFPASQVVDGKRIWGYGRTPDEAERDLQHKISTRSIGISSPRGSVHDLAKRFWYPSLEFLRPLTKRRYMDAYALHVFPVFGHKMPGDLNRGSVQEWVNSLASTKKLSASSIGMARHVLRQLVRIMEDEALILRDPLRGLRTPQRPPKRERALPVADALKVLERAKESDLSAPVFLAAVLGLRRGEICGLQWDDLDRVQKKLRIKRQRQHLKKEGGIVETKPKTAGSSRVLYLTEGLVSEIDARGDLDSAYICTHNAEPWNPERLTKHFEFHKKKLSLPDDWTFHDLRHLAGGLLNAAGVPLTGIASILGHSTTAMSERYVSLAEETSRADMTALTKLILGQTKV